MAEDRTRVAFWSYDRFPYILGAKGEFNPEGDFRAFDYGRTFKRESVFLVLSVRDGETALANLKRLQAEFEQRTNNLHIEMLGKADAAFPGLTKWLKDRGSIK